MKSVTARPAKKPYRRQQRGLAGCQWSFLTQPSTSNFFFHFAINISKKMVAKFRGDQRRFSWIIFAICMIEVFLWAAPPVSALASGGATFTTGDLYRNHMMKDKDHYNHAGGLQQHERSLSATEDAVERLLERESYVRMSSG